MLAIGGAAWLNWWGSTLQAMGLYGRVAGEEQVVEFLTNTEVSHRQMGREHGVNYEVVRSIRLGRIYKEIRPDIPRWTLDTRSHKKSCWDCVHCEVRVKKRNDRTTSTREYVTCSLGFPEPLEEGARFANQCSVYTHKDQAGKVAMQAA